MAELGVGSGRLDERVALITGAGSGIGRAMAEEFAARGAQIVACDIVAERTEATRDLAQRAGAPEAIAVTADISVADGAAKAVAAAEERLGRIDILCSNAGILDDYRTAIDTTEEQWDQVFNVNLKATWLMSRAALPGMLERGSGCIIVTASVAGMIAGGGGVAYTASKHGVIGLMRQLSYDYAAKGIKVNADLPRRDPDRHDPAAVRRPRLEDVRVHPGDPERELGQPAEIAKLAALIASDDVPFMHGSCLVADGGWTMK